MVVSSRSLADAVAVHDALVVMSRQSGSETFGSRDRLRCGGACARTLAQAGDDCGAARRADARIFSDDQAAQTLLYLFFMKTQAPATARSVTQIVDVGRRILDSRVTDPRAGLGDESTTAE